DALLINGDLFDFWFEYRPVIPRRHFGTMAKLQSVRARDVAGTLAGGNHDRWGGEFHTKDVSIAFHAGQAETDVPGRRPFVAHTHRTALAQLPNGRAYLNPGALLDGGKYAVVTKDGIQLETFQ